MFVKKIRYFFEWLATWFFCRVLYRRLPLLWASNLGGWLARTFGPLSSSHKTGIKNLSKIYPDSSLQDQNRVLQGVWDNLGRVIAEYSHPQAFIPPTDRVKIHGEAILHRLRDDQKPALLFTGHFGNWQIISLVARSMNLDLTQLYRSANNADVDQIMRKAQEEALVTSVITKGPEGGRQMIETLRSGGHILMLGDVKYNNGIESSFMGHPAMTAPALARLALKYDCPLVPIYVVRKDGVMFDVVVEEPLSLEGQDIHTLTQTINDTIESWVRARPEQWMWVHKRWMF